MNTQFLSSEDDKRNLRKRLLLINTAYSKKKFILQKLKKLDYEIFVVNKDKPTWAQKYVDHWILSDTNNHEQTINKVKEFLKDNRIDGVLTFWEDDVLLTSKIVSAFNLKGVPYEIAEHVRNKFAFRTFSAKNNIPAPRYQIINNQNDLDLVRKNLRFPIVFKPAFGSSSSLVMKVETPDQLFKSYEFIEKTFAKKSKHETALHDGSQIFAEEYINGEEVDVDMLLQNGKTKFIAVSDNYDKSVDSFFVDKGQATPS